MVCIKLRFFQWMKVILFACCVLFLFGCKSSNVKEAGNKAEGVGTSDTQASSKEAEEKIEPMLDPYLSQDVKIPGAANKDFQSALASMQSGDWALAEKQLLAMTVNYPELSGPYVNLGIAFWRQNSIEKAEGAFSKAIELNPLNGDAYLQYALMQRNQGKFVEAEALLVKALEIWPHNVNAHRNLGVLYDMYMGKFDLALKHFKMVQKLLPKPDRKVAGWIIDLQRR